MISDAVLRRALGRVSLMRFFPSSNPDAVAAVGELFAELYASDAEVEQAVSNILRDPDSAEWPGAGAFFELLKRAVYEGGMLLADGRWLPHPRNGPEYDRIGPDGARHWHDGVYWEHPRKAWEGEKDLED